MVKYGWWLGLTLAIAVAGAGACSSGDTGNAGGSSSSSSAASGSGGSSSSAGGSSTSSTGGSGPMTTKVTPPPYGKPYQNLSDWNLFTDGSGQTPADGVIPYEVNAPLFTDYATKTRFLYLPKGKQIHYDPDTIWDLPVGAALVKTFGMLADLRDPLSALRLIETRILFHEPDGWSVQTYVWSPDQKDAALVIVGTTIHLTFTGEQGETVHDAYQVPSKNDCTECHAESDVTTPLGPKTRQMNRDHDFGQGVGSTNQIDRYVDLGLFDGDVPGPASRTALVDPYGTQDLGLRVRAYWDGNCAHCHNANGYAASYGLLLDYPSTAATQPPVNWGTCKVPTSGGAGSTCGATFDVVPGDPDASIMACWVASTDPDVRMPPLGMQLVNQEGLDLIRSWIASLPPETCQ